MLSVFDMPKAKAAEVASDPPAQEKTLPVEGKLIKHPVVPKRPLRNCVSWKLNPNNPTSRIARLFITHDIKGYSANVKTDK